MIYDYSQKYKKSEAWKKLSLSIRLSWSGLIKSVVVEEGSVVGERSR